MPRLPDQLQTLVAQEGGGLQWPDESGPVSASEGRRARRDISRLDRLYTYALRHPAPERDRVPARGGATDSATRSRLRAGAAARAKLVSS